MTKKHAMGFYKLNIYCCRSNAPTRCAYREKPTIYFTPGVRDEFLTPFIETEFIETNRCEFYAIAGTEHSQNGNTRRHVEDFDAW